MMAYAVYAKCWKIGCNGKQKRPIYFFQGDAQNVFGAAQLLQLISGSHETCRPKTLKVNGFIGYYF